ncbi:MAG: Mth938-like domain-containing protein [Ottowia sp.]|uniref:Mth938-like domain-containing protein n=1 Tax=Ottowia sp. TaxID=1898956 RepID=UPI0039E6525A
MKFQPDQFGSAITGYGPGWVAVAGQRIAHSLVLHPDGQRSAWPPRHFADLGAADFAPLARERPELVVFGSGERLRFPRPAWVRALIEAGIGIETMDTPAACRTYNILAGEGRRVVAALLVEPGEAGPDALK